MCPQATRHSKKSVKLFHITKHSEPLSTDTTVRRTVDVKINLAPTRIFAKAFHDSQGRESLASLDTIT